MSFSSAVPRGLQDADRELEKLVLVGDRALEDLKARLSTDQYFDIAHMPDWVVDSWLRAFGWPYKWVDPADKRLLLKLLPIIYREGGTNNGIILISQAFGGAKDRPVLLEPIVYCQPLSEMNGLSSEYATFCDDFYYNSLTLDIELPLGVKGNLKEILAVMKAAWVRYRYTFRCRESVAVPSAASLGRALSLCPGVLRWWYEAGLSCGYELSGEQLHSHGQRSIFRAYRLYRATTGASARGVSGITLDMRAWSQGLSSASGTTGSAFGYCSKAEPLASPEAPTSGAAIGLSSVAEEERGPWFSPVGWFDPGKSLVDALTSQACAVTQMP